MISDKTELPNPAPDDLELDDSYSEQKGQVDSWIESEKNERERNDEKLAE